jgi:cytidylate kinase
MVVAIDGPAGAGKSIVARTVARELGFTYLDSGAMYRAVALAATERRAAPDAIANDVEIELGDGVVLDGRDVTDQIRTPAVSAEQAIRDQRDLTRAHAPLQAAPGAVELDTTGMTLDEVVERIVALVREARGHRADADGH